jgi:site-specific DNA recombinase
MATVAKPLRAAIYVRISKDREGAGLGVERQETECRALAERLGWEVVAVHVDNDISAYSGKPRPGYRAMLDAVRAGQVQAVLAWHTDRLHRRPIELEEFISLAEAKDLQVQTVKAGDLNLSTPSGRMVARMLGAAARNEVDQTRDRIRSQKRQAAAQGKYRGGPRPYGYESDGVTIRDDEAQIIKDATTAVLAGRTLSAIARDLREAGRTTPTGKRWDYDNVRDVLLRPRNAGLISTGRPGREGFAVGAKAEWPAIVERETWDGLYRLLTDPSRRQQDGTERRWLGTGIFTCGRCGAPMRVAPHGGSKAKERGWAVSHHYRCTEAAHLTIEVQRTDRFVLGAVAELLRDPRLVAALTAPDPHLDADRERRSALAARLAGFERDYEDGLIDGRRFAKAAAKVEADLAEVEERIAASVQAHTSSAVLAAVNPGQAFLDAPLDVQRAVLRTVLAIEVLPSPRRGMPWTSDRLRLTRPGQPEGEAAAS